MTSSADISCWADLISGWVIVPAAGIAAVVALGLWALCYSRAVSLRGYLLVFVGCSVAMAMLLAWQREHRESIREQNLAALKAFNSEANLLLEDNLRDSGVADDAVARAKADRFYQTLESWVANNIGPRSQILLGHDPKDVNIGYENTLDKDRAAATTEIVRTKEKIAALIEARASDRCVKPATAEHPIPPPNVD